MSVTALQEVFAQAVASGMNQSDAYRAAYNVRPSTKPETVNQSASRIMSDPNVAARVAELRKPVVEAAQITLASHLERLRNLSETAEEAGQMSAAINAEIARGKASGLYVDKVEHSGNIGGELTDAQLDARIAALKSK